MVVHPGHALAGNDRLGVRDLSGLRIIVRSYCELWPECRAMLEANGIDLRQCHEVNSDHDAIGLLESGLGVGLLPVSTLIGDNLCALALDQTLDRALCLYVVAGRQRSPVLNSFVNLLRATDWSRFEGEAA
ncbi:MAG: LysR family transcriptional regulator substrate-binding protein [Alphaproteobacteria bacterium]|nr:LysR family transcriptional regulator substrate-binding protein [Rhodospirillaceae bacterium]MDG2479584.1 LysR family transcriptional regulator substrate-binding protein [Alphaproteobacteria bacterium]MBT6202471.1 LysR family transcriptional regulator substrate-binding protein [Rhodospirillaceae bacterium]MBT6510038.1 LysR family transcriptional regulator substrate-binding protein [Rhodospirillaceae bacterium]MBT7614758.1 LysR family transcriptional regulator substrate-binding protein [Rhodo